jgi:hypothetical protein
MWLMWCYCDCGGMRSTVVIQSCSSQGAAEIANASCVHSSCDCGQVTLSILPHTHAFRCSRPGQVSVVCAREKNAKLLRGRVGKRVWSKD